MNYLFKEVIINFPEEKHYFYWQSGSLNTSFIAKFLLLKAEEGR